MKKYLFNFINIRDPIVLITLFSDSSVECEIGYKCSLNSIIGNPVHVSNKVKNNY